MPWLNILLIASFLEMSIVQTGVGAFLFLTIVYSMLFFPDFFDRKDLKEKKRNAEKERVQGTWAIIWPFLSTIIRSTVVLDGGDRVVCTRSRAARAIARVTEERSFSWRRVKA